MSVSVSVSVCVCVCVCLCLCLCVCVCQSFYLFPFRLDGGIGWPIVRVVVGNLARRIQCSACLCVAEYVWGDGGTVVVNFLCHGKESSAREARTKILVYIYIYIF